MGSPASATTIMDIDGPPTTRASAGFNFPNDPGDNFGDSNSNIGGPSVVTTGTTNVIGSFEAGAGADFGLLGAAANYTVTNSIGVANASGDAFFRDYVTITAPGMSGTGTAQFGFFLHGTIVASDATIALPYTIFIVDVSTLTTSQEVIYDYTSAAGSYSNSLLGQMFTFTFGEPFEVEASLSAGIQPQTTSFPDPFPEVIAQSDFLDTAVFKTVLVYDASGNPLSDFAFASESGSLLHPDAVTGVAEPPAAALMLLGIAGLGLLAGGGRYLPFARL